ncbi:MAG: sugar ABC transporter ATP-binding protein [Vallitaleaceae bacterium]|nr:sugar ABC transporter ATP-binding protein [Vallitaleaceae bacterium]
MIALKGINKSFGTVVALKDARLDVKEGEIMALLGSNGSGKSTMIKILSGLYNPNSGSVMVDGNIVNIKSCVDAHNAGIATAFQDLSLVPTMTVIDNLVLGIEPLGRFGLVDRVKSVDMVKSILDRLGVVCDIDAYVQTLPTSTQSMVEVAKAILLKPKILLLDEVTASLHHDEIKLLFKLVRELKAEGIAIVFVTHRMGEVFELSDRVTIMRSGITVIDEDTSKLSMDDIVYHMTGKKPDAGKGKTKIETNQDGKLVLDVKNLKQRKVRDISLQAYKGEIIGIAGLQGQGQPAFIRTVLGLMKPEDGSIIYKGKQTNYKSPANGIKNGMGFISGDRNKESIFQQRSIEENIYAGKAATQNIFKYVTTKEMKQFSRDAIDAYNIVVGNIKDPATSLSGGNQQKLVVSRWIALAPDLLLLDDPTKGVDVHSRREIQQILRVSAEKGMTVIISSSENEELMEIADRIYVFYEGEISGVLKKGDMSMEKLVAAQMGMISEGSDS